MSEQPYIRIFQSEPVHYDLTHTSKEHKMLATIMRKYFSSFSLQTQDIFCSFALEMAREQKRNAELRRKLAEAYDEKRELERMMEDEEELNSLMKTQERLKQEINGVLATNEKLKWKIKSLELELSEVNQKLTKALRESFELRKQLQGQTQKVEEEVVDEDAREMAVKLSEENQKLRKSVRELEEMVSVFEEEMTKKDMELSRLEELEEELRQKDEELFQLQVLEDDLTKKEEELRMMREELKEMKEQLRTMEEDMESWREEMLTGGGEAVPQEMSPEVPGEWGEPQPAGQVHDGVHPELSEGDRVERLGGEELDERAEGAEGSGHPSDSMDALDGETEVTVGEEEVITTESPVPVEEENIGEEELPPVETVSRTGEPPEPEEDTLAESESGAGYTESGGEETGRQGVRRTRVSPVAAPFGMEIIRKLTIENEYLKKRLSELLTINRKTSSLANVLIEMRKQMLKLER